MRNLTKKNNEKDPGSIALVIVAAGASTRMGGKIKKEYLPLEGGTVLSVTARIFLQTQPVSVLAIAIPEKGEAEARAAFFADRNMTSLLGKTSLLFVQGGKTRQQSVHNALEAIAGTAIHGKDTVVLVHDGARPFVPAAVIRAVTEAAQEKGAAVPALQPVDTQKEINAEGIITRHLQRRMLAAVQTPQGFTFQSLLEAHRKAALDGCDYTDDTEIWGKYVGAVQTVPGAAVNRKITYPEDIPAEKRSPAMIRTGLGYDLHPLVTGRKLLLGGVELDFDKGEAGHSDGDVLLHAITDAVLGAAGLGDIGSFFPPEDPQWKGADSGKLLAAVWKKIREAGWELGNMDCVVAIQEPKFLPYRESVRLSIAEIMGTTPDRIFVKAKTGEKMGKIGRGEAVEAWTVCLLEKR